MNRAALPANSVFPTGKCELAFFKKKLHILV